MEHYELSGIWRYPVKALRGAHHPSMSVVATGLQYDRHWMVADEKGEFLSQRVLPRMILVRAVVEGEQLILSAPGMERLTVPLEEKAGAEMEVAIWSDQCNARIVSPEVDQWLGCFLQKSCHLVYLPREEIRNVDTDYSRPTDQVGFADGFPFLLISTASLDDLNSRLEQPVSMERFRPNLVVSGCAPYAEDGWQRIRIGEIEFRVAKPCSRCSVPLVNPETGMIEGKEPLHTLSEHRKRGNKVFLGQNLIHDQQGWLEVGMRLEILD